MQLLMPPQRHMAGELQVGRIPLELRQEVVLGGLRRCFRNRRTDPAKATYGFRLMAYIDNFLDHLLAAFTGQGYSQSLARDFWRQDEDLFDATNHIALRWFKLLWVYSLSAFAQIVLPGVLAIAILVLPMATPLRWCLLAIAFGAAWGLLFAFIFSTTTYIDILRQQRKGKLKN